MKILKELPCYIEHNGARWHISATNEGQLSIRLIEIVDQGTPRIFTHMPSGNVVLIDPGFER